MTTIKIRSRRRRWLGVWALLLLSASVRAESSDPRLASYRTPPGWRVEIAATEPMVINPVTMTFGADGRLFVVEWQAGRGPNDHIKVLTDTDGNGTFDKAEMYMDHLELPAGVLFWDGWTYVTLDHDVVRFKDRDGDGTFETREAIVTGFGNDDSHHRVSGMTLGPDGWLYLTTGDSDARAKGSDGSTATVLRSGGVFRCKPDGSRLENVAFGMRNPWGNVAFDDEFHLFHTDNDNEGTPGFTGCRILHVVEGGDYGWRLREGARCCAPDFERATWNGGRPGRLGWIAETGRGAPAGLCVLNSAAFPASTRNLLVYPDVFRKLVRAYTLKPAGATYTVAEEFELLASNEGLFRPTDAEIGPDGALYILDWRTDSGGAGQLSGNGKTGRIYRMTWAGTEKEPARPTLPRDRFVKLLRENDDSLIQSLSSEDHPLRRMASLELIRRGVHDNSILKENADPQTVARIERHRAKLGEMIRDPAGSAVARRHALLVQTSDAPGQPWTKQSWTFALLDSDPTLRRVAIELIGRFSEPDDRSGASVLLLDWAGKIHAWDAQQTRAFAVALGRFDRLRSAGKDEEIDFRDAFRRYNRMFQKKFEESKRKGADEIRIRDETIENLTRIIEKEISRDMVVNELIQLSVTTRGSDSFLRDGITRGLEHLGPTALDFLVATIKVGDPNQSRAALYCLQGWRNDDALAAVVSSATGANEIPAADRAGLFRTLRELGPAVPPDPIANWLGRATKADPAPRVEAIHVLTAMHDRAQLAAGPVLPALLADAHSDVRRAALALAGEVRSKEAKAALVELVKTPERPADERRLALSALRGYEDKALAPTLAELFKTSDDAGFQAELLRTLASLDFKGAAEHAERLLTSRNDEVRREAIGLMGQKPGTALRVANLYNEGKLPKGDLSRVIEAVRTHATPELQAAMQTLLKNTLLAAPTGAEAQRLREFVGRFGNPDRGKAIYLDTRRGNCTTCHRMEGVGGAVGPDLTRLYETLSFDKRVESILEPSKEIKEGFGTFKVASGDGRVVTGLLLADTPEAVTLKDSQGREVRIPAKEIEEKGPDKTSLMPAGVVGQLSFTELADLLAFLGDRKAQESLRGQKP